MKKIKSYIFFIISIILFISFLLVLKMSKPVVFKRLLSVVHPVEYDYHNTITITDSRKKIKPVSKRRYMDFINVMDGRDGNLIQIQTYEVKADINSSEESAKAHRNIIIRNFNTINESNINYTKPVEIAYEQKALEYATQNNYELELPYMPLKLVVSKDYFDEHFEIDDSNKASGFSRDSLILKYKKEMKPEWKIRIGDTGMTYYGTFTNFYRNILNTNIKENIYSRKNLVQLYRYFDPQYPNEKICLSYASDFYRTFFILSGSRIYYIDSILEDETELDDNTLINQIAPMMAYIASSIRPSQTEKPGSYSYRQYAKHFAETVNAIKNDEDQYNYDNALKALLEKNPVGNDSWRSTEEKLLISRNLVKQKEEDVFITRDSNLDYFTKKLVELRLDNDSKTPEQRRALLNTITKIDSMIQQSYKTVNSVKPENLLQSYYLAWLLQNYDLPESEKRWYVNTLTENSAVAYRPALFYLGDSSRNEYFYKLFANRLFYSRKYFDISLKPEDILPAEDYKNNKFAFLGFEPEERPDAAIVYNNIVKMNAGAYVRGKFVLVVKDLELSLGDDFKATDVHAIVLDEASIRFFPTAGRGFNKEKAYQWIQSIYKDEYPPYLYYGDYNSLKIEQNGLTIFDNLLGAKAPELLNILCDIQRAYYQEDLNYYFTSLTSALEEEIHNYVLDQTLRPSPELTIIVTP